MAVGDAGYQQGSKGLYPWTSPEKSGDVNAAGFSPGLGGMTPDSLQVLASSGVSGSGLQHVTNTAALIPIARTLQASCAKEIVFASFIDSETNFDGTLSVPSNDVRCEKFGWPGQLRTKLNSIFGGPDGGQFIPAEAAASDTRVANGGGVVAVANYSPFIGYTNGGGSQVLRKGASMEAGGHTVTYTFTGRYLNLLIWENAANYNGTFTYAIDGAGAVSSAGTGLTDTYRIIRIDCTTDAAHSVVLTWVSGKIFQCGAYVSNGSGVVSMRLANGGANSYDLYAAQEKVRRSTLKSMPIDLFIFRTGYNEANKQATGPWNTTPANFGAYLDSLIVDMLANPSCKSIILLPDTPWTTVFSPATRADYIEVMKSKSTGKVAYIDLDAVIGSHATAMTAGYTVTGDAVGHPSEAGNAVVSNFIAQILTDRSLFGV